MIIILSIIAVVVLFIFLLLWKFSSMILYPELEDCNREHYVFCEPQELGVEYEDISFRTEDNLLLKGWYLPVKNSKKSIVLVHGIISNRRECLRWTKSLNKAGYNILVFDLRNHGDSDKTYTSMGYHEKKDVVAAVDFLINEKKNEKIGLLGISMGGATGIGAMIKDKRIQAGIFEAVFANLADQMADVARRKYKIPRYPFIPILTKIYSLRSKVDVNLVNPEDMIGKISPRPVFVIHGVGDDYVDFKHGQRLFQAAGVPKKFWESPCTVHGEAWQAEKEVIEKEVVVFFDKNLI